MIESKIYIDKETKTDMSGLLQCGCGAQIDYFKFTTV